MSKENNDLTLLKNLREKLEGILITVLGVTVIPILDLLTRGFVASEQEAGRKVGLHRRTRD